MMENIDDLLKDKFSDRKFEFNEAHWEKMEGLLDARPEKKKRRIVPFFLWALLLTGAGIILLNISKQNIPFDGQEKHTGLLPSDRQDERSDNTGSKKELDETLTASNPGPLSKDIDIADHAATKINVPANHAKAVEPSGNAKITRISENTLAVDKDVVNEKVPQANRAERKFTAKSAHQTITSPGLSKKKKGTAAPDHQTGNALSEALSDGLNGTITARAIEDNLNPLQPSTSVRPEATPDTRQPTGEKPENAIGQAGSYDQVLPLALIIPNIAVASAQEEIHPDIDALKPLVPTIRRSKKTIAPIIWMDTELYPTLLTGQKMFAGLSGGVGVSYDLKDDIRLIASLGYRYRTGTFRNFAVQDYNAYNEPYLRDEIYAAQSLHYAVLPIIFEYHFENHLVQTGIEVNKLLASKVTVNEFDSWKALPRSASPVVSDTKYPFISWQPRLILGYGSRLNRFVAVWIRGAYNLKKVSKEALVESPLNYGTNRDILLENKPFTFQIGINYYIGK